MGKTLRSVAAAAAAGAFVLAIGTAALADDSEGTAVTTVPDSTVTKLEQEVSPSQGPDDCGFETVKLDDMGSAPDTWTLDVGDVTFDVEGDGTKHYSVAISGAIGGEPAALHAIHLAVGADASSYYFDPPVTSAANLTVKNPAGKIADVSHIWFCFGPGKGDKDPTPTPTSTGMTPVPTPSEPGEPGEPGEENGELPTTGSQVATLVGLGTVLLLAGGGTVAMMAIRRRRKLSDLMDG